MSEQRLSLKQKFQIFFLGVVVPCAVVFALYQFTSQKILFIILVNLVYFFKTLTYKYSSDDIPVSQRPPRMKDKFEELLCWLDARIRFEPQADHAMTTVIHAAVAVFIYTGFGSTDISFLAAILFSFNPTNNQGSVWISGRAYALAALGLMMAMTFPKFSGPFVLLMTYTNAGFLTPIVLMATKFSSYYWLVIPFCWFINWKRFAGNVKNKIDREMITEDKAIKPEKIILAIKTFGFYTMLSLIPFQNAFYHSYLQSSSGSGVAKAYTMKDRFFFFGLAFIGFFGWYVCTHWWDLQCFAILLYCVALAPFCNFMRMSQETAERYCYLPNVGLMFLLATLLIGHPVAIALVIGMYVTRMWFLMDMYADDYFLLEHTCLLDPGCWFAWHVRGMKRWDVKSYQEAVIIWSMCRMISPKEFKVLYNLATVCAFAGHIEESKHWLAQAEANIPAGQESQLKQLCDEWRAGKMAVIT